MDTTETNKTVATPPATVHCAACCGTGRRALNATEAGTLAAVSGDWTSTAQIASSLPSMSKAGVSMRLARLIELGLIEKRRSPTSGRVREWRRL